mgnify:CR=1 FL=1
MAHSFSIFISSLAQSQNYTEVDTKVKRYPLFSSAQQLATQINNDFSSENEKVRALFIWLTKNIQYDIKEYYNPTKNINFSYTTETEKQQKLQQIKDAIVHQTFTTKKSICEGYAQSFKKVCDLLNIEATIINGYARNAPNEIGRIPFGTNHAWNAVKLNNKWQLIDATWAAGSVINNRWEKRFNEYFFYPTPSELVRTHLPEKDLWQLLDNPISKSNPNHVFGKLTELNTERVKHIPEGGSMKNCPPELQNNSDLNRSMRRLSRSKISHTIVHNNCDHYYHPTENRRITIREMARIQGYSDEYVFLGSKSEQSRQVGNSVPVGLGKVVAKEIYKFLNKIKEND